MSRINLTGATQNDSTFAVPGATGCGLNVGLINAAVNAKTGLPSAAGNNSLTLNDTRTHLTGLNAPGTVVPDAGKVLSRNWHSAAK
ncbi:Secreted protein OS=Streptomyces tendae OX=1932 GN=GUR47_10325 PE=4 SV=1 [Streptomyces tendae]